VLTKIEISGQAMDESKADDYGEGYFQPKKLIRNMTKELQASKLHISDSSRMLLRCVTQSQENMLQLLMGTSTSNHPSTSLSEMQCTSVPGQDLRQRPGCLQILPTLHVQ
jgi:uncharacterized membrane-anchored protein YhcB (DUF1043 family)